MKRKRWIIIDPLKIKINKKLFNSRCKEILFISLFIFIYFMPRRKILWNKAKWEIDTNLKSMKELLPNLARFSAFSDTEWEQSVTSPSFHLYIPFFPQNYFFYQPLLPKSGSGFVENTIFSISSPQNQSQPKRSLEKGGKNAYPKGQGLR